MGWLIIGCVAVIVLQTVLIVALSVQVVRYRLADDSLKDSEVRIVVATLPDNLGLWRWSAATEEFWATPHVRAIVGLPEAALLTRAAIRECVLPEDRPSFDHLFGTTGDREVLDADFRIRNPNGEIRWVVSRARPWRDTSGRVVRASGVIIDVTDRKRVEAESLHQRQQLAHLTRVAILGQLSGALAHELNQPLTSILSNAQAAQRFLAEDVVNLREVRDILGDIVSDDKRADEVIRRLRAMLKSGETQIQQLDLTQLVREVLALAHSDLVVRRVDVNISLEDGLPPVAGDRVQVQQVLLNLLLNASEAMNTNTPGDRRIDISAAGEGRLVHVSVKDHGTGIEPDQLENVFDAFFTTKTNGLGLGLSICRSIITAHGGRLWATNNEDGGSTFHFTLPALAMADAAVSVRS